MPDSQQVALRWHATPDLWLGAPAPGGLALPAAMPTADQLYAPRGVFFNDEVLVVADSGNHRVLIWHGLPASDHASADVVLGQPDFHSEGPKLLHLPTGVWVDGPRLYVADAWHHRVLVWEEVPTMSSTPPDFCLGQADLQGVDVNRGGSCGPDTLYWPYGVNVVGERLYVSDTGNRRVLWWTVRPGAGDLPDGVLGQPDFTSNSENRGVGPGPQAYRWPHGVAGDDGVLLVADAGNQRVLLLPPHPESDAAATGVLGQKDLESTLESQYSKQSAQSLRFPYAVARAGKLTAVADTANNRVLLYENWDFNSGTIQPAAVLSLGQDDLTGNGENRWKAVTRDSLCWPYGLHLSQQPDGTYRLAVADSGNNRVMLWTIEAADIA